MKYHQEETMRTIRISDEVWEAMSKVGKFGETPDDVLRRAFRIEEKPNREPVNRGPRVAQDRMSARIEKQELHVEFAGGDSNSWPLPKREDKAGIRKIREAAVEFARSHGASHGQRNAVRKALTDAGYHLTK